MYVYWYLSINTYHSIIDICTVLFFLTASVTLLTSTLGVLVRDTQMLMQAILRILFYFSPILWLPKNHGISGLIHEMMKYNPVYFIAESYRSNFISRMVFHGSLEINVIQFRYCCHFLCNWCVLTHEI